LPIAREDQKKPIGNWKSPISLQSGVLRAGLITVLNLFFGFGGF